ncbi:MAG: molybdenum cofactor biosynthesis protein MoaE [Pseudomonadaceae bacterium]|nr:molybdenum cofactor biosynthesis protein MoaE [Pseudomonadaceae bacterium]
MQRSVIIQTGDFDAAELVQAMRRQHGAQIGALVTFTGLVREQNLITGDSTAVATLTLEHYPGMTERSIHKIVDEAQSRWDLLNVCVLHRVGTLAPSEQIVFVAVASAHRDTAFAAAEFVMDYLKTNAVFWKREQTEEGTHWVESAETDHQRASQWHNDR